MKECYELLEKLEKEAAEAGRMKRVQMCVSISVDTMHILENMHRDIIKVIMVMDLVEINEFDLKKSKLVLRKIEKLIEEMSDCFDIMILRNDELCDTTLGKLFAINRVMIELVENMGI